MPQELPLERQQPQDAYDKALADDYHDDDLVMMMMIIIVDIYLTKTATVDASLIISANSL